MFRLLTWRGVEWAVERTFTRVFRHVQPDVVLAEYGTTGLLVKDACRANEIPLIVHFHGFDASVRDLVRNCEDKYQSLFDEAGAIVAVSRDMEQQLLSLGAPRDKLHYNCCGIDCDLFQGADPKRSEPTFVAVGRFAEKKGPHLTIAAFSQVHRREPAARLRMIGDGALLEDCRKLVDRLQIQDAVEFLGAQPPEVVAEELRCARAFVQHSIVADNGDSEGTPVAVLEAGASGLPVVATHHGGIPDVVIDGTTGFLVGERDVDRMAECMLRLLRDPQLAADLGSAARQRVNEYFAMNRSIDRLFSILSACVAVGTSARVDLPLVINEGVPIRNDSSSIDGCDSDARL